MLYMERVNWIRLIFSVLVVCACAQTARAQGPQFVRGDLNSDGQVSWADIAFFTNWLHFPQESPAPLCLESADTFNDGILEVLLAKDNDFFYLMDFLFLAEEPPSENFPTPDLDLDGDQIDCGDGTVAPPGGADPNFAMSWESPEALIRGQQNVGFFLRVTSEAPEGFSAAFLVNRNALSNIRVDVKNTVFPQDPPERREEFEASSLFRVELIPTQDPNFDLLLVAAIFVVGAPPERILLGALSNQRIFRLLADVNDDADEGDSVTIFLPTVVHLIPGPALVFHGIRNEFILSEMHSAEPETPGSASASIFDPGTILRGDSNQDRVVDISDAIHTLGWLFTGGPEPPCLDEADSNKDRAVDLSDGVFTLSYLFVGGPQPEDWPEEIHREAGILCGHDFDPGRLDADCGPDGDRCPTLDPSTP